MGASVVNVNLFWVDLKGVNLEGAVVRHYRVNRVSLIGCNLRRADFSQST